MAKKKKPADQSRKLNNARFEFLKRNKERYDAFLNSFGDESESWDDLSQETKDDVFSDAMGRPAVLVDGEPSFDAFSRAIERAEIPDPPLPWEVLTDKGRGEYNKYTRLIAESKLCHKYYLEELIKDAPKIVEFLMKERSTDCLLVSIDLTRSTETIVEEIKKSVISEKRGRQVSRLKWLPMVDELLAVWDMRGEGKSFSEISKSLSITTDRAKKQFYRAFSLITDQEYDKIFWVELLRSHLERIAIDTKPTDNKFWNTVSNIETVTQKHFISKDEDNEGNKINFIESTGQTDNYEILAMTTFSDLRNICKKCTDISCRTATLKGLTEFEAGDEGAFEDLKPCQKFYDYLKN